MTFYEELEREFKVAGIKGKIVEVPENLRPTKEDYADLERRISIRVQENDYMLLKSSILADRLIFTTC